MTTAAMLLQQIKDEDQFNIGLVMLLDQDQTLERLTAAWPNAARLIPADRDQNEVVPPDLPVEDRVRWLWARVEPAPEPLWCEVAGLPDAPHIQRAMRVLQDMRCVFPDGTLSQWAEQYIRERVGALGVKPAEVAE